MASGLHRPRAVVVGPAVVLGGARRARRSLLRARAVRSVPVLDRCCSEARLDGARPPSAAAIAAFGAVAVLVRRPTARSSTRSRSPRPGRSWIGSAGRGRSAGLPGSRSASARWRTGRCCPGGHHGVWGVTFVVVFVNATIAILVSREGRGAHRVVPRDRGHDRCPGPRVAARGDHRRARRSIAVVQIDVRSSRHRVRRRGGPAGRAAQHRGAPEPGQASRRRPRRLGRGALDPAALQDPATVAATHSAIAAVGVADDGRRGRERPGRHAAHERAGLRRTRRAGGPLRQGAPGAIR